MLVEDFPLQNPNQLPFNCFGYSQTNADKNSIGVAGALVVDVNCPSFNFNTFLPIQGKQRLFLVGKEPGQVVIFPEESLPTDWVPVWQVSKGRRRSQVTFCGTSLGESEPTLSKCKNRKKLQKWKEILWHDRKKILPPTQQNLRALWKRFQQEAERV